MKTKGVIIQSLQDQEENSKTSSRRYVYIFLECVMMWRTELFFMLFVILIFVCG